MEIRPRTSLNIGDQFPHDIVDDQQRVILPAGSPFTEELGATLREQNINIVFVRNRTTPAGDQVLEPYKLAATRKVRELITDGPEMLEEAWDAMRRGDASQLRQVDSLVSDTHQAIQADIAAFLSGVINATADGLAASLEGRSVRLSALTLLVASLAQFSDSDCNSAGRAALLHDIALDRDQQWPSQASTESEFQRLRSLYLSHPLRSIEVLRGQLIPITELESVLIAQIHEQCDGTGFPRGLRKRHLHPLSRIINIADAFLTLTDVGNPQGAFVPADALAYLIHHAIQGVFDLSFTKIFVKVAAAYPIGTQVRLSDNTLGLVMRSTNNYCEPVIRRIDDASEILDLRNSKIRIEAPAPNAMLSRLPKSRLDENLWTPKI